MLFIKRRQLKNLDPAVIIILMEPKKNILLLNISHYLCQSMTINQNKLIVKRSGLPDTGKGLFTKIFIPKGTAIVEYKGTITTWKDVDHTNGENG